MVPGLSASAQGAATQALQRRHSGALCRAKSIHGELAGVGMCMWLVAAAWLASMVPGLSASAQGAATQALQRRHSGALKKGGRRAKCAWPKNSAATTLTGSDQGSLTPDRCSNV